MRRRAALVALAVAATVQSAHAAVDFSFNGFGTLGYAQSDTDEAVFGATTTNEGIDKSGSWKYDSMVGLQGSVRFGADWSVTAQGVVRQQSDGAWTPSIDWAYLSWQPIADVRVRAGLTRVPTFMFSDSVFLGFANTWVRPPHEVYGLSPIYLLEGVDVVWRKSVGPVMLSVQPYYGDSKLKMPVGTDEDVSLSVKDWYGLVLGAEWNSFTFRAGYGDKTLEEELPTLVPLVAGITTLADRVEALGVATGRAQYSEVAADYRALAKRTGMKGNKTPIFNFGAQYDNGREFVIGEFAQRGSENVVSTPELTGMYLTFGRRFGSLVPYVTAAQVKVDSPRADDTIQPTSFATLPAGALRTALMTSAVVLDGYVDSLAAAHSDQNTLSAGVRYELPGFSLLKGAVVKVQVDHINAKDDARGFLQSMQPGFDGDVNVYSATFDFVF